MSIIEKEDLVSFPLTSSTSVDILRNIVMKVLSDPNVEIVLKDEGKVGHSIRVKGKLKNFKINMVIWAKADDGQFKLKIEPGFNTKSFYKDDPLNFNPNSIEYLYGTLWNAIYTGFGFPARYSQLMSSSEGSSISSQVSAPLTKPLVSQNGVSSAASQDLGWADSGSANEGWGDSGGETSSALGAMASTKNSFGAMASTKNSFGTMPTSESSFGAMPTSESSFGSSASASSAGMKGWIPKVSHNLQDFRPIVVHQLKGRKIDSINPLKFEVLREKVGNMVKVQRAVEQTFGNMNMEIKSKTMDETGSYVIKAFGKWGLKSKEVSAKVSLAFDKLEVLLSVDMNTRLFFDPNIRSYDINLYEAVSLVRFWDLLCTALDLPKRDDIGSADPELYNQKKARLEKARSLLVSQIQQNIENEPMFMNQVTGFTDNYEFLIEKYNDLFNMIEGSIKFNISNVYRCGYQLNNSTFSKLFLDFEEFDIDSPTLFPCIATYVLYFNKIIEKEITYTYKNTWVVVRDDEESRKMVNFLNIESPYFANRMKEFFEEFRFKFEDKEIVTQRDGKRKTIEYTKDLFYLISIRHIYDENGKDCFVFMIQHFLRSPKTGYLGMYSANKLFDMVSLIANQLERFIIVPQSGKMKQIVEDESKAKPSAAPQPCPFCKWLLSSDAVICPRCKKNVGALKKAQNIEEMAGASFNKALALMGAEEKLHSDALISSIDNFLDDMDFTAKENQAKIIQKFREVWSSDGHLTDKLLGINDNTEEIKQKYGAFINAALSAPQNYQLNSFAYFHLPISELHFNDMIVVICKVKDLYSKYFAPVILYICPFPIFNFPLKCTISTDGKEIKWHSEGEGQNISEIFNDPNKEIAEIMKKLYEVSSTYHFMPKKKNILDKLEPVKGMDYIFEIIVQSKNVVHRGETVLNLCIMYQFLKCDLENFEGFIQPSFILKAMDLFYESIDNFLNPAPEGVISQEPAVEQGHDSSPESVEGGKVSGIEDEKFKAMFGAPSQNEIELDGQEIVVSASDVKSGQFDKLTRSEFVALCLNNEINPMIKDVAEIDRQITEIQFQMSGIKDLETQADAAFVANQIDFNAYNAQKQQIKEYMEKFEIKIRLLEYIKSKIGSEGWQ